MEEGEPCPIPSAACTQTLCRGGCFHVEAKNSPEAVAAVERRATPETAHIAPDFLVLVTLPGAQFNEYRAPDA